MIILIQKRHIILCTLFGFFFVGLTAVFWMGAGPLQAAFAPYGNLPVTVVVDPGHGGEDGGAVSTDGSVTESQINLNVAQRVFDLLVLTGQNTIMTRTEDISIHSISAETARQKKISDLHNRAALVNGTENAVLLSIHQNSLPSSPVTHGAQVFWNTKPGADELAQSVQDALNLTINSGNEKHTKQIPSTIYLMKNITVPGILVECGFLSNAEETLRLQEPAYQIKLAAAVTAGYLSAREELS